jgi:hypothetical protein
MSNAVPADSSVDYARGLAGTASNQAGTNGPSFAFDVDPASTTFWQGLTFSDYVQVNFAGATRVNRVRLKQNIALGTTTGYSVQYCPTQSCDSWSTAYQGTTIGSDNTITFPAVTAYGIRIQMTSGTGSPALSEVGVYLR